LLINITAVVWERNENMVYECVVFDAQLLLDESPEKRQHQFLVKESNSFGLD